MMNIVGCLDTPTKGTYLFENENVATMNDNELADIWHSLDKEAQALMRVYNNARTKKGAPLAATQLQPEDRKFKIAFYDPKRSEENFQELDKKNSERTILISKNLFQMTKNNDPLEVGEIPLDPCPTQAPSNFVDCGFVIANVATNMLKGLFAPIVARAVKPDLERLNKEMPQYLTDPVIRFGENQVVPPVYFIRPTHMPNELNAKSDLEKMHIYQFRQMLARLLVIRGEGLVFVPLRVNGNHWILMIVSINVASKEPIFNLESLELAGADDSDKFAAKANSVRAQLEEYLKEGVPNKKTAVPAQTDPNEPPKKPPLIVQEYLGYEVQQLHVFDKNNVAKSNVIYLSWDPETTEIRYKKYDGEENKEKHLKYEGVLLEIKNHFQIDTEQQMLDLINSNPYFHTEVVYELAKVGHVKLTTYYEEERCFEKTVKLQQQQVYTEWLDRRVGDVLDNRNSSLNKWIVQIANQYHYSFVDNAREDARKLGQKLSEIALKAIDADFKANVNSNIFLTYMADRIFVQLKAGIVRSIAERILEKNPYLPDGKNLASFVDELFHANPELETLKVKLTSSSPKFDAMEQLLKVLQYKLVPKPKIANGYSRNRTLFGITDNERPPEPLTSPPALQPVTDKEWHKVIRELITGLNNKKCTSGRAKQKCEELIAGVETLIHKNVDFNQAVVHLHKKMNENLKDGAVLSSTAMGNFNKEKRHLFLFALGMMVLVIQMKKWTQAELHEKLCSEKPQKITLEGVEILAENYVLEAINKAVEEAQKPLETFRISSDGSSRFS